MKGERGQEDDIEEEGKRGRESCIKKRRGE